MTRPTDAAGSVSVVPDGHVDSLTCPCGPVAGPSGLMHTTELEGGPVSLLPAPPGWSFTQTGPTTFEWIRDGDPAPAGILVTGAMLVAHERRRQVDVEGYDAAHDRQHGWRPLYDAGVAYIDADSTLMPNGWELKPTNPLRDFIKAGALFQAAIDVVADQTSGAAHRCVDARDRTIKVIDGILDEVRRVSGMAT